MTTAAEPNLAKQPGLLSNTQIIGLNASQRERFKLVNPLDDDHCKGAKYDIAFGFHGRRNADGTFEPEDDGKRLVLLPGDSAWIVSAEQFCLPADLSGSVALRAEYANRGLMLLSGKIIDPGYGSTIEPSKQPERVPSMERRLHFFVANFGSEAITLEPRGARPGGGSRFASVQFVGLQDRCDLEVVSHHFEEETLPVDGLGFISSLKEIQSSNADLSERVARSSDLVKNLVFVAYFVMSTAIISASLATILSITANGKLVTAVNRAVPDTDAGKGLIVGLAFSLALAVASIALALAPRREAGIGPVSAVLRERAIALEALRAERRRKATQGTIFAIALLVGLSWATVTQGVFSEGRWPLALIGFLTLLWVFVRWMASAQSPITEAALRAKINELNGAHENASLLTFEFLARVRRGFATAESERDANR